MITQAASWSLGMWWRRSLPRHIGLELLVYIVLYYSLQLIYRCTMFNTHTRDWLQDKFITGSSFPPKFDHYCIDRGLLDEDQRAQFADIVTYFNQNLTPLARDLAFLLGFYVKVWYPYVHSLFLVTTFLGCGRKVVGSVQNSAMAWFYGYATQWPCSSWSGF